MSTTSSPKVREKVAPNLYRRISTGAFEVGCRIDGRWTLKTLHGARNITEAKAQARDILGKVERNEIKAPSAVTLDAVWAERKAQLESLIAEGKRRSTTLSLYTGLYEQHIEPEFGATKVDKITTAALTKYYRGLGARKPKRHIHRLLVRLFKLAVARGYIVSSPLERLDEDDVPSAQPRRVARVLDKQEMDDLVHFCTDTYKPIVTTLLYTGCRVSELRGLTWGCVDFADNTIEIVGQLDRDGVEFVSTKTAAGQRSVPMLPLVRETLLALRKTAFANGRAQAGDYVFTTATGGTLSKENIRNRGVVRAATKAGISGLTTHDLRKSFSSHAIRAGMDPVRLANCLGHTDPSVTLRVYSKEFSAQQSHEHTLTQMASYGFGQAGGAR